MNISKYCANGNDFLIFHSFYKKDYSSLAIDICNRHNGLGADGLIVLYPHSELDFEWDFYNCDGTIASMCGNATRCASHYSYDNHLVKDKKISFLTKAGIIDTQLKDNDIVSTKFPYCKIIKEEFEEKGLNWIILDTGVPHIVNISSKDIYNEELAIYMRTKYNANVNFAYCESDIINIRTFERGVEDETLACGTGMASVFFYAMKNNFISLKKIEIVPKSQDRLLFWIDDGSIYFKGRVQKIFSCSINK